MNLLSHTELWSLPEQGPYLIVVTTNAVVDFAGNLIMGVGSAYQAKQLYPFLPQLAVKKIREKNPSFRLRGWGEDYGFIELIAPPHGIGIFQTKRDWKDFARLDTIQKSTAMLKEYAEKHPDLQIRMPFPGIGAGKHSKGGGVPPARDAIEKIIASLPDNVTVVFWG